MSRTQAVGQQLKQKPANDNFPPPAGPMNRRTSSIRSSEISLTCLACSLKFVLYLQKSLSHFQRQLYTGRDKIFLPLPEAATAPGPSWSAFC